MTVQTAEQLKVHLDELKQKRKNGELQPKQYYSGLLSVLKDLTDSLIAELDNIDDADVRAQIPLILVILEDQIKAFAQR